MTKTENTDDLISVTSSSNEGMQQSSIKLKYQKNSQVYLSFTNLHFSNDKQKKVDILVNGEKRLFTTDNIFSFFNLGYTKRKKLSISMLVSLEIHKYHLNLLPSIV